MKNTQCKWWHKDYILPLKVEQGKLSLSVPRKAAKEYWQTLVGSGDTQAKIFFNLFFNESFLLSALQQLKEDVRLPLDFYEHFWKSGPGLIIWSLRN